MAADKESRGYDTLIEALKQTAEVYEERIGTPISGFYGTQELWDQVIDEVKNLSPVPITLGFKQNPPTIWGIPFYIETPSEESSV